MPSTINIMIGQQLTLDIAVVPNTGKQPKSIPISWTNSDPTTATLSAASGHPITVTGVGVGTTTITAIAGTGDLTATYTVNVEDPLSIYTSMSIIATPL